MTTSVLGGVLALVVFLLSTSPSLLPRPWWAQGLFSGVLMVSGYLVGFVIDWVARSTYQLIDMQVSYNHQIAGYVRAGLLVAFAVFFTAVLVRNYRQLRVTARLVEMPMPTPASLLAALVTACGVVAAAITGYWMIYLAWQMAAHMIARWVPHGVAVVLAWVTIALVGYAIVEWGIVRAGLGYVSRKASQLNRQAPKHVCQPQLPQRSGSPPSLEKWERVGREGKRFLGGSPMLARLREVWPTQPVSEPVRVYASLARPGSLAESLDVLKRELQRTRAFERKAILIVVPTGSGWVDEWNVQAFEYLMRGDCATVSLQYSYLPSWLTFISRRQAAAEGGRMLFATVANMVASVAPQARPKLYITGESLGAFGGQAAFTGYRDMLARVDGALWIGTPGFTELLRELTSARHRGSPQVAPVVDNARHVRFATKPADLTTDLYGRELGQWNHPRVVYVQHASDPVVWWSPQLAWSMPDWIGERAGLDVSPHLRWHRLITCGQVMCDLPLAESAPSGHGHLYHRELIPAWRAVLGLSDGEPDGDQDALIGDAIADNLT